jgi:putative protease
LQPLLTAIAEQGGRHYLETPPVMKPEDFGWFGRVVDRIGSGEIGVIANNYGALQVCLQERIPVIAGAGLSLSNSLSAETWLAAGVEKVIPSGEINREEFKRFLAAMPEESVIVNAHGPLVGMVSDICIPAGSQGPQLRKPECQGICRTEAFALRDHWGQQYRIMTDGRCYQYLLHPLDFSILGELAGLEGVSLAAWQIDMQLYDDAVIPRLVQLYGAIARSAAYSEADVRFALEEVSALVSPGLCAGALTV